MSYDSNHVGHELLMLLNSPHPPTELQMKKLLVHNNWDFHGVTGTRVMNGVQLFLLDFWTLCIVWYSEKAQHFRNWICFCPQVKRWEILPKGGVYTRPIQVKKPIVKGSNGGILQLLLLLLDFWTLSIV
jgi:hypothetical protein